MKKVLLALAVLLCVCLGICGCNADSDAEDTKANEHIDALLQSGEYPQAYNTAESSEMKEKIIAENFLAYACYDITLNVDSDIKLIGGSFGQAKASTADTYVPNNEVFAIDNYAKLAEYVSMMSGEDILTKYYYGVLVLKVEGYIKYGLASVSLDGKSYKLKYVWDTLEQTYEDDNVKSFYKYVARYIVDNGTSIDKKAVARINEMYLSDSQNSVKFEFDLRD